MVASLSCSRGGRSCRLTGGSRLVVTTSHCWSATYLTKNRDSEASTNKEPLLIHDALVGIDHRAQTAVLALRFGYLWGKAFWRSGQTAFRSVA